MASSKKDPQYMWPKWCPKCRCAFDEDTWEQFKYMGIQRAPVGAMYPDIELRQCKCGNTVGIYVEYDVHDAT